MIVCSLIFFFKFWFIQFQNKEDFAEPSTSNNAGATSAHYGSQATREDEMDLEVLIGGTRIEKRVSVSFDKISFCFFLLIRC